MNSTKEQRQEIYRLCGYNAEAKEAAVSGFTAGRTASTTGLSYQEANALIERLGGKPFMYDNWALFDRTKPSHRQILSLCIQLGWSVQDDRYGEVADLHRLSKWLRSQRSPVMKKLRDMSAVEVSKIIGALEKMIVKKWRTASITTRT